MVQVVFVHGVATREGVDYSKGVKARDQLFRQYAFANAAVAIKNVYWGKFAAKAAWHNQSLPRFASKAASFGLMGGLGSGQLGAAPQSKTLSEAAQRDFAAAVDALFIIVVEQAEAENRELSATELADFAAAGAYAHANAKPFWFKPGMTDTEIVQNLRQNLPAAGAASFGVVDYLREAASAVFDRGRNLVSTGLTAAFRDDLSPLVGEFLGDVFVYLKAGDQRQAIRSEIAKALSAVKDKAAANEPLIIIGHSLGGVILIDMLSDPASGIADLDVDLLLTVGSQPGFFEEQKLFVASRADIGIDKAVKKAPKPAKVKRWWNVYDPVDLLSFRCDPIFDGVEDFAFNSVTGLFSAHTTYFKRTSFHERLNRRVRAEGLLP